MNVVAVEKWPENVISQQSTYQIHPSETLWRSNLCMQLHQTLLPVQGSGIGTTSTCIIEYSSQLSVVTMVTNDYIS